jgi:peptide/nickel transport system substrate-binding protein
MRRIIFPVALVVPAAVVAGGCGHAARKGVVGRRGGTMIVLASSAPAGSPDPQVNYTLQEWQLLLVTHDGLVAFKRASGKEGTKLVPDLAESIPEPTDGGRTWRFTLRPRLKFSDGKPLTGRDVRATFERLFRIGDSPNAASWYSALRGGAACLAKPKNCGLSQGIVVDGNRVTFHLARADPEFLDQLAIPFSFILPAGTRDSNLQIPPAGTGPYKWVEYASNKQIKLVRNPYFHSWSAAAQPAGKPNVIVERFGLTAEAEVTQIEDGEADFMADQPPADRLAEISRRYPDQVHLDEIPATWYFAFNVRQPPFDNAQARRAVNYATDRASLVKIFGGPRLATPTCQILPPRFPGYRPYCPYTIDPGSGKWTAPDPAKGRELVAASGTRGEPVKVTTDTTETDKALGLYFVGLLNQLGYKASLQALSPAIEYPYVQNSRNRVQFALSNWYPNYPAASDFLNNALGCSSFHANSNASPNLAEFCDRRRIQPETEEALKEDVTDPAAANRLWSRIDHELVDLAVWDPIITPKKISFVSRRLAGFEFSPQWTFLLDQASVK